MFTREQRPLSTHMFVTTLSIFANFFVNLKSAKLERCSYIPYISFIAVRGFQYKAEILYFKSPSRDRDSSAILIELYATLLRNVVYYSGTRHDSQTLGISFEFYSNHINH